MISRVDILVVDDEEALRDTVEELLVRSGFNVATARDGAEALRKLAERHFDVVITDMNMPVIDGLELIRRIGEQRWPVEVIPMSGAHPKSYELLLEAVRLGGRPPLNKPFTRDQLLAAVKGALESRKTGGAPSQ